MYHSQALRCLGAKGRIVSTESMWVVQTSPTHLVVSGWPHPMIVRTTFGAGGDRPHRDLEGERE
jgi:hypothetical protein